MLTVQNKPIWLKLRAKKSINLFANIQFYNLFAIWCWNRSVLVLRKKNKWKMRWLHWINGFQLWMDVNTNSIASRICRPNVFIESRLSHLYCINSHLIQAMRTSKLENKIINFTLIVSNNRRTQFGLFYVLFIRIRFVRLNFI